MDSTYCALLTIFLLLQICHSIDTITSSQFISDAESETLLSSNGVFRLGFFSPSNSSDKRFVGIWFDKVPLENTVWVANRDTPLLNKDGVFKITNDGNVAVFPNKNATETLWSSNVSVKTTVNTIATLTSAGNLVLSVTKGSSESGSSIIWQSFDYPTNIILAGMKFGVDKRTGLNRFITSWREDDDPARGEYSVKLEVNGLPQFYIYKNTDIVWRGGPWNGLTLSGVPIVAKRLKTNKVDYSKDAALFSYSYIDTDDEVHIL